jgi:hypothetical protein
MEPIKLKTWILWAAILFALGVGADYFFLHVLFYQKNPTAQAPAEGGSTLNPEPVGKPNDVPVLAHENVEADTKKSDNFLESLKKCAPEIAAQTIATPEALLLYLRQSVGIEKEDVSYENFHMTIADGSERRIHVVTTDSSNSPDKKEIRFFKLDKEGFPEKIPLKATDTLASLMAMGQVHTHEVKREVLLKDKTSVSIEEHNDQIYEFQYSNHGKILSCRIRQCQCP